jgi:hypothetical protein
MLSIFATTTFDLAFIGRCVFIKVEESQSVHDELLCLMLKM